MKLARKFTIVFNHSVDLMAVLAGILLIFAVLSINVAIASRSLLGRPIGWVTEISSYIPLYITFLVATWVLKSEGHIKMDLVLNRLNPRTQSLINMITSATCVIVCFILTWYGAKVTWQLFQTGQFTPTVLELPKFIIIAIIPVGLFLLLIQFLKRTHGYLGRWKASRHGEQRGGGEP